MKRTGDVKVTITSSPESKPSAIDFEISSPSCQAIEKMPIEELYALYHISVKFQEHIVDEISKRLCLE